MSGIDAQRLYFWRRRLGTEAKRGPGRPVRALARLVPAAVRVGNAESGELGVIVRVPGGGTLSLIHISEPTRPY